MSKWIWLILLSLSPNISTSFDAQAGRDTLHQMHCEKHFQRAAERHRVPVAILHAVGLVESGRRGRLNRYAMNVHGQTHFPTSLSEAMAIYHRSIKAGQTLIDVGCMQINTHYHGLEFLSVPDMFDPGKNVNYAARFLRTLKDKHSTWTMAIARYHAGFSNDKAQRRYVCLVIDKLIELNKARPTRDSKNLCKTDL